jgi:nitrogenase molybdenum-cofactor synthesis protein NifE
MDETFCLSIGEINGINGLERKGVMSSGSLHDYLPGAGGWDIIRFGLLLPESVMLIAAPAGCGRHDAINGLHPGFKERLFFIHNNDDLATGQHLEKVYQAAAEILYTVEPKPKAMLIYAIDDLLAPDYEQIAGELEKNHGIPVRACHMNPFTVAASTLPNLIMQQSIYDFIPAAAEKDGGINIIGSYAPLDFNSEFYQVVLSSKRSYVRHIAACSSLEELYLMGRSSLNILVKPGGILAGKSMYDKLGISYCYVPVEYGIESINNNYRRLEVFLDTDLKTDCFRTEAENAVRLYRNMLGNISVAVGETAYSSPFELARALNEYGFSVPCIFTDHILNADREHINWLGRNKPRTKVFANIHPTMAELKGRVNVDLAIGFDTGSFGSGVKTVPFNIAQQPYGYQGVVALLRQMLQVMQSPHGPRKQMHASGMVV